jgi:hypothetical protein
MPDNFTVSLSHRLIGNEKKKDINSILHTKTKAKLPQEFTLQIHDKQHIQPLDSRKHKIPM